MPEPDDGEWVAKAKQGDRAAFDALMQRYQQEVIALAFRMLGDREDAVDLAQETFLRAWKGLPHFRQEAAFRSWLYQIALNLARNRRRWYARHRVSQTVSLEASGSGEEEDPPLAERIADQSPDPRELAARAETQAKLVMALDQLPQPLKEVVILRDVEGISYEEITEILRERIGTVKSRLHRARAILRSLFAGGI